MDGRLLVCCFVVACATPKPPEYSERCTDAARPCAFSYDFEPSGAALDVFADPRDAPAWLVVNEDGLLFSWGVAPARAWDHAHVEFARSVADVLTKVESAASAVCDGTPVALVASNFMPGRSGRSPRRERIIALVGQLEAPARVLEKTSAVIAAIAAREGVEASKVEGLALSADCRTLYVGLRSVLEKSGADRLREVIYPVALDIDWKGTREEASLGQPLVLQTPETCSGADEGISSLEILDDGTLLALTSYELETHARANPEDLPTGILSGSLWRRSPTGMVDRLACFPGHKPEALLVAPDHRSVRVVCEDDEYGGRPISAYAVRVELP